LSIVRLKIEKELQEISLLMVEGGFEKDIYFYLHLYCTGTKLTDRDNDHEHIICPVMTTPHIFNYLNIN